MQEEQSFQIHGADASCHVVCEGSERERQEVGGSRHGEIIQIICSCECIKLQWMQRSIREKQGKERCRGRDSCFWDDSISRETIDSSYEDFESGRVLGARHLVECVEDDIQDDRVIGQ